MLDSSLISIFAHTHQTFAEAVFARLGKGKQLAITLYQQFYRTGKIIAENPPADANPILFKAIADLMDQQKPRLVDKKEAGFTGKFLLRTADDLEIESVLIPMQAGGTLCVSSQIGCRMGCTFCETGRMGLLRNLTIEEIVSQVFIARHDLQFAIRNIVFMGMGEPFDNYENVMQAVKILNDAHGLSFGRNHLTISTSGHLAGIEKLTEEGNYAPNLAVSINAPENKLRNKIMPINRKQDLTQLYQVMKNYNAQTRREILIAYVLMQGINDSVEQADQLADYLQGLKVKINLIPYNHQSCDRFRPSSLEVIENFAAQLRKRQLYALVRETKGREIMAACGQLGNLALRTRS